jgi:hypothetical protein
MVPQQRPLVCYRTMRMVLPVIQRIRVVLLSATTTRTTTIIYHRRRHQYNFDRWDTYLVRNDGIDIASLQL